MSFSRDNALEKALVISVDTGGTFTDFIALAPGREGLDPQAPLHAPRSCRGCPARIG